MARERSPADPYRIFAEEHGVDSYYALIKKFPELKDHGVDFLASRAVYEAMAKASPLETRQLNPELAARALASVISSRTLLSSGEVAFRDEVNRISEPSSEEEGAEYDDRALRIYRASQDPQVFEYISSGKGKETLINQLKLQYDLTEQEARDIVASVEYGEGQ